MEIRDQEKLDSYIRALPEPEDYLDGASPSVRYEPRKILLFSRLNSSEFIERVPIVHYRFNLIISLKSSLHIHIDNEILTLNEGESLLIFPFQHHYYLTAAPMEMMWCYIGFDLHQRNGLEILKYRTLKTDPFELECLEKIFSAGKDLKAALLSSMLHSMTERASESQSFGADRDAGTESSILSRVQEIVYRDMNCQLTTRALSDELGISESGLHKQFHLLLGISPGRYIREAKINYACSILETGNLNISETADRCGYDSLYSFSRAFKKMTGFSPSDFRKNRKRKDDSLRK